MKKQPSLPHHDQNTNEEKETAPTAERHDLERHRLKKESMFPHQADGTQAYRMTEKASERPLLLPNERDASEPVDVFSSPSFPEKKFYNWGSFEFTEQQRKQDDYHRKMEQLQTTRFINGLRRAVDKSLRNRGALPNSHNLPNYAYNNTTKELARLHQQSDYVITRPESSIHDSPTHIKDHIEHHVLEFQRHRVQVIQQNGGLVPHGSDTDEEEPT